MTTKRITIDIDRKYDWKLPVAIVRMLIIFRKFPKIERTKKGWHLTVYLDNNISNRKMFLYRKLLFDDERRILLDMVCKYKPKQVLFEFKRIVVIEDGKITRVR